MDDGLQHEEEAYKRFIIDTYSAIIHAHRHCLVDINDMTEMDQMRKRKNDGFPELANDTKVIAQTVLGC